MTARHFIIPDIHGSLDLLRGLLRAADVLDAEDNRVPGIVTVSVGDLANAVYESEQGDGECLAKVPEWIDQLILGNHEMGYIYGSSMSFGGFYEHPALGSLYRSFYRDGTVVPSVCLPELNLLITHAGVAPEFGFKSAVEARDMIYAVWQEPVSRWEKLGVSPGGAPLRYLLGGVGAIRGGYDPASGIFWRTWQYEQLEKSFSQICGHTPLKKHDLWRRDDGTFSLNIDVGAKQGRQAVGVMLADDGSMEFTKFELDPD